MTYVAIYSLVMLWTALTVVAVHKGEEVPTFGVVSLFLHLAANVWLCVLVLLT